MIWKPRGHSGSLHVTYLSSGKDLSDQEVDADGGYPRQELFAGLWPSVEPLLGLLVSLATASFHHVRHQGPRRPTESDQGDLSLQRPPGQVDGFEHVAEFLVDVDKLGQSGEVLRGPDGVREGRSRVHLDGQAHSLGDDKDVTEDDGGIEETLESADGLHGQFTGDLGSLAAFEKGVIFPDRQEF